MYPFISVIITAYNKAQSIGKTIQSVLDQKFTDYEMIVVDDGSTDETCEVVQQYRHSAVVYYTQPNKGVTNARNKGAELAKGKYLVFLDADDWVADTWLGFFYNCLHDDSNDIVFCDVEVIDKRKKDSKKIRAQYPYRDDVKDLSGLYLTGAFCVAKDYFKKLGGYDEQLSFGENSELGFRFMKQQPRTAFTNSIGLCYEISGTGQGKNNANRIKDTLYIIQKHPWYFKKHPNALRLYFQSIAVAYKNSGEYKKAMHFFARAWLVQLQYIKHLAQLLQTMGVYLLTFFKREKNLFI